MAWRDINSLTINAASANIVNPLGRGKNFDEITPVGLRIEECFESTEMPAVYGTVMTITHADLSSGQLLLQWVANGSVPKIFYRSHRNYNIEDWTQWYQVAYTSDITKMVAEQYAKLEAKVLSRIETNSLNTNDMQLTENQGTNGGGYFGYLNFKLGGYAVSVRQKGGQRNGLERYCRPNLTQSSGHSSDIRGKHRPKRILHSGSRREGLYSAGLRVCLGKHTSRNRKSFECENPYGDTMGYYRSKANNHFNRQHVYEIRSEQHVSRILDKFSVTFRKEVVA